MNLKSKILNLLRNISLQEEAIVDLKQIKEEKKSTSLEPDNDLETISDNLKNDRDSLKTLGRQYNQEMLSKMVKGGIKDDEMVAWWMNRY
jgi:hypothetical protein